MQWLKNAWKRDLEIETWTAGYKYSWRKMEVAATEDRAGWRQVLQGLCDPALCSIVTRHKSSQVRWEFTV